MTSMSQQPRRGGRGGQQGQQMNAMQQPGAQPSGQALPPTGIQQQLNALNQQYSQVQGLRGIGFDVRQQQMQQAQGMQGQGALQGQQMGSSSLDQLAQRLAQSYGLAIGRGRLVDDQGNMLMTPDQLANASGGAETLGSAAIKMQYISQAVAKQQNIDAQKKGISAIQAGMGQVQSRGRGSLASMQSGMYQDLADLYSNQQFEAADFSYFVQKEQMDIQATLQRKAEKLAKKQARFGFVAGIAMIAGGNWAGGAAMAAGSAAGTGWF